MREDRGGSLKKHHHICFRISNAVLSQYRSLSESDKKVVGESLVKLINSPARSEKIEPQTTTTDLEKRVRGLENRVKELGEENKKLREAMSTSPVLRPSGDVDEKMRRKLDKEIEILREDLGLCGRLQNSKKRSPAKKL